MNLNWQTDSSGVMRAQGHGFNYIVHSAADYRRYNLLIQFGEPWVSDQGVRLEEAKALAESHHAIITELLEKAKPEWIPANKCTGRTRDTNVLFLNNGNAGDVSAVGRFYASDNKWDSYK